MDFWTTGSVIPATTCDNRILLPEYPGDIFSTGIELLSKANNFLLWDEKL